MKRPLFPVTYGIPEEHTGLVQYHICTNGIYMTKKVAGRGTVTLKIDGIPGMGEGKEMINVLPSKIPIGFFWKIVQFFRMVESHFAADLEAFILLAYDYKKEEYFLWVPPHTVTMGSVKYDISSFKTLFPDCYILLDCHSHGSKISGFFSSTDDKDDNRERFSMVIGKIDKVIPEQKIRFSSGGKFFDFEIDDIFGESSQEVKFDMEEGLSSIRLVDVTITKGQQNGGYTIPSVNPHRSNGSQRSLFESIRYQVREKGFSIKELMGEDW